MKFNNELLFFFLSRPSFMLTKMVFMTVANPFTQYLLSSFLSTLICLIQAFVTKIGFYRFQKFFIWQNFYVK